MEWDVSPFGGGYGHIRKKKKSDCTFDHVCQRQYMVVVLLG